MLQPCLDLADVDLVTPQTRTESIRHLTHPAPFIAVGTHCGPGFGTDLRIGPSYERLSGQDHVWTT
jgi:hypothetical protein